MTHHELQPRADLLLVPVTLDVRNGNLAIKFGLGRCRIGRRHTRTRVTVYRNMEVRVHSSMILSGLR